MDIDEESIVEYSSNSLWERMSQWKNQAMQTYKTKPFSYWILFLLSIGGMLTALPASSLLSRVYNTNGGKSKWIISWASVAGWPITALMLLPIYLFSPAFTTPLTLQLVLSYVGLGFLTAAHDLMFAYAYAYLPASSATLLASSSLVFSCLFGYFIVNNKLNASAINSTVIIIAATTIISLDSDTDRYDNVSNRQYISGFIWDVMASALHGLIYALSELVFVKFLGRRSFHVVVEQQTMVSLFAFVFVSIGVIVNGDFEGMKSEAKTFVGGEDSYIKVIVWAAITFQLGSLGATGVVYLGSSVMAGIVNAVRNPITSIVAVVVLNDPMSGLKMMSLLLTLWGFACYIYGNSSSPR
ncbi:probable purine permease 5 isoform X1 [Euphorbia lathyris]|uniref:probable purine permease 5 isoform X1 n=1 Tax=Euphorbia lathyris TaxID=212925 RepID=UPI0033144140